MHARLPAARVLAVLALGLVAAPGGGPLALRLNHRLAPGEIVIQPRPSRDARYVDYVVASATTFHAHALYRVPADGSRAALQLSPAMPAGRRVGPYLESPDAAHVAFTCDRDVANQFELFVAPSDGSQPALKLNDPLTPSGDVGTFLFTPDGTRVVFVAEGKLYVVPVDASQPPTELASGDIQWLALAASGTRAVYKTNQFFSVPVDGSAAPLQLSPSAHGEIPSVVWQLSPDGRFLVYRAQTVEPPHDFWVFSVPVDGSAAAVQLFDPVVFAGFGTSDTVIRISPDSQWVVQQTDPGSGPVPPVVESAPIDGSGPVAALSPPLGAQGHLLDFRISVDGRVVFAMYPGTGDVRGLFVAPIDGSASALRITPPAWIPSRFEVTRHGLAVFYGRSLAPATQIFSVPLDGSSSPIQLNGPLVANGDVADMDLTLTGATIALDPSERLVAYLADEDTDGVMECSTVPADGSAPARKANRPLVLGGDVIGLPSFTADARALIYYADQRQDDVYEAFVSEIEDPTLGGTTPLPDGTPVHR